MLIKYSYDLSMLLLLIIFIIYLIYKIKKKAIAFFLDKFFLFCTGLLLLYLILKLYELIKFLKGF